MNKEEAIKILDAIVKVNEHYLKGIERQTISQTEIKAIETVLNYIEELENNFEYIKYHIMTPKTVELNYIPKQVILDKIEELEELESELSDEEGYWGNSEILYKLDILREILDKGELKC